jgi:hypothetical protein
MNQSKYKWILFLVAVLLISNVFLAIFLFSSKEKKTDSNKKRESPSTIIYKELGLTNQQIDTFKTNKDLFFKDMRPIWDEIKNLKDSLYGHMDVDSKDSSIQLLTAAISQKTKEADLKMYQHFVEMRKLCTSEQQVRFDTIIPKFLNRSGRGNRR